ncbi:HK97 family phage prohead protease [Sulfitobacter pseudonitzschiae]|uniref:HK97 family phage prohead protease n=1 Tax=Pseudosulfitobacter pseudonitzschiae TaxID=1402135 RepID=A0A9Q2NQH3_9RHOB|nr:HK97 family phage prohead protease [Pseudosulfitobacter pseudonitzschiae]MBM2293759.1 HK97 family phage prohead protease [Pseudosulfitobacter pseudonitzschiae]MBM2298677.1 HK97 family phage prohead protease [Pseudosulfitobacter pseudonitzschiae]MBM2303591.1 HK97 family phage prohead protease [Pseudosulfitobacter pseudonitzschiae]MBM2313374.1 HK97 family phage prohead protease [Pseudosulfitobacter pseudonitzschiae]MBM2318287.1 HK97 family phage prohead protease [Pseudosulfitobacter pseudonit
MTHFETKDAGLFSGDIGHAVPLEMKADDETGEFEGYGAVFNNEDLGGDTLLPGAFSTSLASKNLSRIKLLYQHRMDEVIGHFLEVREDAKGLFVRGKLALEVARAREVHALMKIGALDSMSMGYKTIRSERDEERWTRKLIEVDLWEVSIVTFPQNPAALINQIKSAPETPKDLEKLLRDVGGYSRTQAKAIVADGFKAVKGLRDAGNDGNGGSDLMAELKRARRAFQG